MKIEDLNNHYICNTKNMITQKGVEKSSAWIVPANSLIFSNGATIGACSINKIPVTTKQGILGIVPKKDVSVEFLYYYLTSDEFIRKIKAITTKGIMDCAYLKDISKIVIKIPEYYEQLKISQFLNKIDNYIQLQEKILDDLAMQKSSLLNKLFI